MKIEGFDLFMGPVERWKRKRNPLFWAVMEKYKNKIVKTKWKFGIIWFNEEDPDDSELEAFKWVYDQIESKEYRVGLSSFNNSALEIDNVSGWRFRPRRTKSD